MRGWSKGITCHQADGGPPWGKCSVRDFNLVPSTGGLGAQQWQWPVSPGEWKAMHNLHPCHSGRIVREPFGNDRSGYGKRPTGTHRLGHPIPLIIKILLVQVTQL